MYGSAAEGFFGLPVVFRIIGLSPEVYGLGFRLGTSMSLGLEDVISKIMDSAFSSATCTC